MKKTKDDLRRTLLPCPFCGCKIILLCEALDNYAWCTNCGAEGGKHRLPSYTSKKNYIIKILLKAVESWNKRVYMKTGDYIYYQDQNGDTSPGRILQIRKRIKISINHIDGNREIWVNQSKIKLQ
jgi:hypothetical protein